MSNEDFDYFHRRMRQERSAAKLATSLAVRRVHQEMALRYSVLITASMDLLAAA